MTASTPPSAGGIFVSYRRDDAAYPAGWLHERLAGHFGPGRVFKDVDSIQPGDDFVENIMAAVGSCATLLAVIGVKWLTVTGEDGRRRLDDPGDLVRLEIEAALTRGVQVIPVLVDGARMPAAADLPASLQGLARRHAVELNPGTFDTSRLLRVLDSAAGEPGETAAGTEMPQGTVTFLFTDLEGSTRLWEAHPAEMRKALARHDTIVRGAVQSHGGVVFSTMGDGMAAVFASARDAVRAVLAAHQGLAAEDWGEVIGPKPRPSPATRSARPPKAPRSPGAPRWMMTSSSGTCRPSSGGSPPSAHSPARRHRNHRPVRRRAAKNDRVTQGTRRAAAGTRIMPASPRGGDRPPARQAA